VDDPDAHESQLLQARGARAQRAPTRGTLAGGERSPLGLLAGSGQLPLEVARAARRRGRRVDAVAFPDATERGIADCVDSLAWVRPGQVGAILEAFAAARVAEVVLAGSVAKQSLWADPRRLGADERGRALLARLGDRSDLSILEGVERVLREHGIRLLGQAELVPDLLAGQGSLGRVQPTPEQLADAAFAWPIARAMARLDVGHTLVVKDRAVLCVEAAEGTDAAIRRAGAMAPGSVVVKVARPGQDPRFDLPAIGSRTLAAMRDARAAALVFEAKCTLVLERPALVAAADAAGIAVFGAAGFPGGI
jgi:hypothetical protein